MGFCSDNCRKSYHKHGGAYRKLRGEMRKMIERRMAELAEQMRVLLTPMMDDIIRPIVRQEMTEAVVDVQQVTDYGHSFYQGNIRPRDLFPSKPATSAHNSRISPSESLQPRKS
jgi:hypothetical protein